MNIRSAEIKDAPAIAGLMVQLGYSVDRSLIERKLHEFSESSIDNVFVAVLEQQVVGCISCHITTLFHQEGGSGRITSLVIDEHLRGSGIGKQLVRKAEQFFQDNGCIKSEVTSGSHRLEAHKFYETCGFQENDRRFSKNY